MNMKYYCLFIFVLLSYEGYVAAYDDKITHPAITEQTMTPQFDQYLRSYLGFYSGKQYELQSGNRVLSVREWLREGSTDEDSPACRASNHFHDPLKVWTESGMSDDTMGAAYLIGQKCTMDGWTYSNRQSAITWATGYLSAPPSGQKQSFSSDPGYASLNWDVARDYYYRALTSTTNLQPPFPPGRDYYFAHTFQYLGNILHLLQDMAVPAHVRNDFTSHIAFNGITSSDFLRWFGNHYEYYVQTHTDAIRSIPDQAVIYPSFANTRLTDFWDTDQYNGNNPSAGLSRGLAEFTNANYLSDSTIPFTLRTQNHMYPYPKIDDPNIQICLDYEPGSTDKRVYLSRKDRGACPPISTARSADHFATLGFWNDMSVKTIIDSVMNLDLTVLATPISLDDNVHNTYAKELVPRAVGYSAALINYFFRGTIEITAPETYVYSITDGSEVPQQFSRIKAKVKNTTKDEYLQSGILQAVVRYKTIPNYATDLSNYPPDGTVMNNVPYSYSVSFPITLTSEQLASMNMYPTEFTFDFTDNPIPAGITDLTLQVVFKGTIGNEADTAVAVGIKDLMEPTHHVFWNLTDMFSLNGHLYTSTEIKINPDLAQHVDLDNDGHFNEPGEPYIDPYPITLSIGYMNSSPPLLPVLSAAKVISIPAGRFIRLVLLTDSPLSHNYGRLTYADDMVSTVGISDFGFEGVINGEVAGIWQTPTPAVSFRNTKQHLYIGILRCRPKSFDPVTGEEYCPYPDSEAIPADTTPYPVLIEFQ